MASAPKLLSLLFLFALFSIQINAREFFSKIPRENTNEKEPTVSVPNKDEQQEPRFSPETQNGYGLYGHEAETNTNTKETYEPYVTPVKFHPDEPYNMIPASENSNTNNKDSYFYSKSAEKENFGEPKFTEKEDLGEPKFTENGWSTKEKQNNNKNSYFYSKSAEKENLGERRFTEKEWNTKENNNNNKNNYYNGNNEEAVFTEKGWNTKENNNNNNNNYYNGNNEYNKNAYGESMFTEKGWSTKENNNNNNNNYYNGEKQGMSDTRFLENGKYYYDLKSENNYYPNQFENSRGFDSRNEFNENRYNNMGRYNQNQEEFGENEEEFEP
ncbi:hypothetical protein HRI_003014100 [Hibiscus trionum]|uniref:Protein E6 n=1 Tax=Hibiscus trionum TaxID=183268 RepID=A0A9W7IDJ0_HIBTR|nr:hypothetical protein HRI_003014100 [Hibiscus trionum]